MENWQQCKDLSKFCRTDNNKDPNALQHWQRERSKFSAECCWSQNDKDLKDYDEEVKINTDKFFKKGLPNKQYNYLEDNTKWTAHYRMIVPLKTKGNVIVKMTFEMSIIEEGITDQDIEKTKQYILNINKIWNGNFALKVTDIQNKCCDPIELPIEFDIQFAYKGEKIANGEKEPHKINLYKKIPKTQEGKSVRPHLDHGATFVLETDSEYNNLYTFAHEFGHALGLPDEYGYDELIDSMVRYYQVNGSLDTKEYIAYHQHKDRYLGDPEENIMSVSNSCRLTERQGWILGIAAKKAINDKRYQCDVILRKNNTTCDMTKLPYYKK